MQDAGYCAIPMWRRDGSYAGAAIIDAPDRWRVAAFRWHVNDKGYATCRAVLMHRLVMELVRGDGREVDHVNRNRLDNRRANLRVVSRSDQMQNLSSHRGASSRFRGVYWDAERQRWRAQAFLGRRAYRLGRFVDEVDAARAVDAWRLAHMPFAEPDPELLRVDAAA